MQKNKDVNWQGLILGFAAFLVIGLCHPLVAKSEYYFGKKIWPFFVAGGLIFLVLSFLYEDTLSIIFGIISFALFWSTIEIFKQHERVLKGQAKRNPKRNYSE